MKLKVKNMKEYGFDPKLMLTNLVSIYNNLRGYKKFLTFLVKDPRSFRLEHFEKVLKLHSKKKIEIRNSDEVEGFSKMIEELKIVQEEIKQQEINYDDAPEEFLDGLNYTLMDDPVLLPTSKVVLDRTTIGTILISLETHLLSDQTDPFNRSKLTKEMLVPCEDLRSRIEEYKKQKKNK
jgi:ubiquitin conjugation factor E4 B